MLRGKVLEDDGNDQLREGNNFKKMIPVMDEEGREEDDDVDDRHLLLHAEWMAQRSQLQDFSPKPELNRTRGKRKYLYVYFDALPAFHSC